MTTRPTRCPFLVLPLFSGCAMSPAPAEEATETDQVAVLASCPVGQWCIEAPPAPPGASTPPLLHSVWAVSADNVFAVGDHGTILYRSNGAWSAMSSGTTNALFGVWAASASDAWAVGSSGTILHFDGTAWSRVTGAGAPTSDINAVWGTSSTDLWLAGSGASHWNGTSFTAFPFAGLMLSLSGTGSTDVWVAGESAQLRHFTGGTTFPVANPAPPSTNLFAVLALGVTDVWVTDVTSGKETMHFGADKTWTARRTGGAIFNGLAARASNDVWGAGGSRVGQWNGSVWTIAQPFGTNVSLQSISIAAGNAWVVGESALIGHLTF